MTDSSRKRIEQFAEKWMTAFQQENIPLIEAHMGEDCAASGFVMDCGSSAEAEYPGIMGNAEALRRIIGSVTDIPLLGSAIFSKWRYFQHFACAPFDVPWFLCALERLKQLAALLPEP